MNLQLKTKLQSEEFITTLITNLNEIGVPTSSIHEIYVSGSALYIENPNDIDLKVMVRSLNPKAEVLVDFDILGLKVQPHFYTYKNWQRIKEYKRAFYIDQTADMILIYGDDKGRFHRFDVIEDKETQRYLIKLYDTHLFNYNKEAKGTYQFKPKRLWNFLLFAYKVKNKSNTLTSLQKMEIAKAHKGETTLEDYRALFNELKLEIGE